MKLLSLYIYYLLLFISLGLCCDCSKPICKSGQITFKDSEGCYCIYENDCYIIKLTNNLIGTWNDGQRGYKDYTQYDVIIENRSDIKELKYIVIGFDNTLKLRDSSLSSIWNVVVKGNSLILPNNQVIAPSNNYTFGFIVEGREQYPNFTIQYLSY